MDELKNVLREFDIKTDVDAQSIVSRLDNDDDLTDDLAQAKNENDLNEDDDKKTKKKKTKKTKIVSVKGYDENKWNDFLNNYEEVPRDQWDRLTRGMYIRIIGTNGMKSKGGQIEDLIYRDDIKDTEMRIISTGYRGTFTMVKTFSIIEKIYKYVGGLPNINNMAIKQIIDRIKLMSENFIIIGNSLNNMNERIDKLSSDLETTTKKLNRISNLLEVNGIKKR